MDAGASYAGEKVPCCSGEAIRAYHPVRKSRSALFDAIPPLFFGGIERLVGAGHGRFCRFIP